MYYVTNTSLHFVFQTKFLILLRPYVLYDYSIIDNQSKVLERYSSKL